MRHTGTFKLETNRLILRRFTIEDADMMFENWASDSVVTKYLTWPAHTDVSITKEILNMWINDYDNKKFYQWGIELKETNELIGGISIVGIDEGKESMEVGYCISKKYWNMGYTTEATKEVIRFCFEVVGAKKVTAKHDAENIASGRVMEKSGMIYTHNTFDKNNTNERCVCKNYNIQK